MGKQKIMVDDIQFTISSVKETADSLKTESIFLNQLYCYDDLMTDYLKDSDHLQKFLENPQEVFDTVCDPSVSFMEGLEKISPQCSVREQNFEMVSEQNSISGNRTNGFDIVAVLGVKTINDIIKKELGENVRIDKQFTVKNFNGEIHCNFSDYLVKSSEEDRITLFISMKDGKVKIETPITLEMDVNATIELTVKLDKIFSNVGGQDFYLNFGEDYIQSLNIIELSATPAAELEKLGESERDSLFSFLLKMVLPSLEKVKLFSVEGLNIPAFSKVKKVFYSVKGAEESAAFGIMVLLSDTAIEPSFDEKAIPDGSTIGIMIKDSIFMEEFLKQELEKKLPNTTLKYENNKLVLCNGGTLPVDKYKMNLNAFTLEILDGKLKTYIVGKVTPSAGIHVTITADLILGFRGNELEQDPASKIKKDVTLDWWVYLIGGITAVIAFPIMGIIATALIGSITGTLNLIIKDLFVPDISGSEIDKFLSVIKFDSLGSLTIKSVDLSNDILIGAIFK